MNKGRDLWPFARHKVAHVVRPCLAFLLPFCLYLCTLAPTIYNLDSAELTTAAATLGITRATGYPLYTLFGHAWSKIPVGDVGYRMNLFSALFGALTIHLADRVLARWQVHWVAALGGLGLLVVAPYFWGLSLIAEVYTLHTALMAAVLLALQRWDEAPTPGRLAWLAGCVGLSLTHHASAFLLIPGIVVFLLMKDRSQLFRPASWLPAVAVGLLAISIFFYLPLRVGAHPSFHYAGYYDAEAVFHSFNLRDLREFFWFISGRPFSGLMFAYSPSEALSQAAGFGKELARAFFVIGIGPGLVGLLMLLRHNRRMGVLLLLWFSFTAIFYIDYKAVDKATMFLPCYLVWGITISFCYDRFFHWLAPDRTDSMRWPLRTLQSIVVVAVLAALCWNWPLVDQSYQWDVRWVAERKLKGLPENSVVVGYWNTIPVMEYLQKVEGMRTDVTLINRFLIPNEVFPTLIGNLSESHPVFLAFQPGGLPVGLNVIQEDELYRVVSYPEK